MSDAQDRPDGGQLPLLASPLSLAPAAARVRRRRRSQPARGDADPQPFDDDPFPEE
jgi:hypothetical protein